MVAAKQKSKSLLEILEEECNIDCILQYIKSDSDLKNLLREVTDSSTLSKPYKDAIIDLTEKSYCVGFTAAMVHVIRVLRKHGLLEEE